MSEIVETILEKKPRRRRKPLLPLTLDDRLDLLKPEIRVSATLDEYFALVQDVDYAIHYSRGEIVSFIELEEDVDELNKQIPMGQAAPLHERLTILLAQLISNILGIPKSEYQGYGSNIKIYVEGAPGAYNPDIAFTKGEAIIESIIPVGRKRSTKVLTNPHILVEVLSKSTRDFDLYEKWEDYQKLESVQQVIFLEQNEVNVRTYIKQGANRWLYLEFKDINDVLPIIETEETISLNDIYKIDFLKR